MHNLGSYTNFVLMKKMENSMCVVLILCAKTIKHDANSTCRATMW